MIGMKADESKEAGEQANVSRFLEGRTEEFACSEYTFGNGEKLLRFEGLISGLNAYQLERRKPFIDISLVLVGKAECQRGLPLAAAGLVCIGAQKPSARGEMDLWLASAWAKAVKHETSAATVTISTRKLFSKEEPFDDFFAPYSEWLFRLPGVERVREDLRADVIIEIYGQEMMANGRLRELGAHFLWLKMRGPEPSTHQAFRQLVKYIHPAAPELAHSADGSDAETLRSTPVFVRDVEEWLENYVKPANSWLLVDGPSNPGKLLMAVLAAHRFGPKTVSHRVDFGSHHAPEDDPIRVVLVKGKKGCVVLLCWRLPDIDYPAEREAVKLLCRELQKWLQDETKLKDLEVEVGDKFYPECLVVAWTSEAGLPAATEDEKLRSREELARFHLMRSWGVADVEKVGRIVDLEAILRELIGKADSWWATVTSTILQREPWKAYAVATP
ncbi:unnamed protein product, partial [Mesorhabditis spiculigera]